MAAELPQPHPWQPVMDKGRIVFARSTQAFLPPEYKALFALAYLEELQKVRTLGGLPRLMVRDAVSTGQLLRFEVSTATQLAMRGRQKLKLPLSAPLQARLFVRLPNNRFLVTRTQEGWRTGLWQEMTVIHTQGLARIVDSSCATLERLLDMPMLASERTGVRLLGYGATPRPFIALFVDLPHASVGAAADAADCWLAPMDVALTHLEGESEAAKACALTLGAVCQPVHRLR
jgi:hypothetical protein